MKNFLNWLFSKNNKNFKKDPLENDFRNDDIYEIPDDAVIAAAEKKLGIPFHPDYIEFIKSGYDLGESILEPLLLHAEAGYLNLYNVIASARQYYDLPNDLLPLVEDNSDYYCLNDKGEVVFWSHNGPTDEKWPNISAWRKQMIAEAEECL